MASYPTSVKSFSTKATSDVIAASHVNDLQDEVNAVESGLINGLAHTLIPLTDATYAFGSASKQWSDAFLSGVITLSALNGNRMLVSSSAKAIAEAAALTNGQLMIGSTGAAPVGAALTAGAGISITNGAGSITIAGNAVLDRSMTEQDVLNTTTATSVYSYSVPGGTLSTDKALRLWLSGNYLNNSGSPQNFYIRIQYGGTTIAGAVSPGGVWGGPATSANRRSFDLMLLISANNATNSQRVLARASMSAASATETDWSASPINGTPWNASMHSSLAIDSTASQTLDVTVQHGVANTNVSFKRWAAILELL